MRSSIRSSRLVIGVVLGGASATAVTAAFALPKTTTVPNNSAATAILVRAYHDQAVEGRAASTQGEQSLRRFIDATGKACPRALAHAPRQSTSFGAVEEAIVYMLQLELVRASESSTTRFAQTVGGLRWTNRGLTARVRSFAAGIERQASALPTSPQLCPALVAWSRAGYARLPAELQRFSEAFRRAAAASDPDPEGGTETTILRLLLPYETPRERVIVQDAVKLIDATGSDTITHLYHAKLALFRALGAMPLVY